MNAIVVTPDIHLFVAAVRERLADLTDEEREELVGGLEADMSDLVAEQGVDALPDPAVYAAELRVAAGFSAVAATSGRTARGSLGARIERALDRAHERWVQMVGGLPGGPWEFLVSLRPAWWVLRAWVALQLIDLVFGRGSYNYGLSVVPSLGVFSVPVLIIAIAGSVQLGRGRLWPAREKAGAGGRLLLLGLNSFAVLCLPMTFDSVFTPADASQIYEQPYVVDPSAELTFRGSLVRNIYPYDAQGRPLVGVQLVDQDGRRLTLESQPYDEMSGITYRLSPWLNGRTELFSVFPQAEQSLDESTGEPVGDPTMQPPPFASLPPVTMAGVLPSVLQPTPAPEEQDSKQDRKRDRKSGAREQAAGD